MRPTAAAAGAVENQLAACSTQQPKDELNRRKGQKWKTRQPHWFNHRDSAHG
jgi:hypothetical protein